MGDMSLQSWEPPRGVTFEEVWALIRENAREFKEMKMETRQQQKETRQQIRETRQQIKETSQQIRETSQEIKALSAEARQLRKETDRQMKETGRRLGELGFRLGDVVEHIMSPRLHEKFDALNFHFNHSSRNHEIKDQNRRSLTEIDILLENGEYAMAVEVKTRLTSKDVKDHVKRMEILRRVADEHNDRRKYLGAVAGAVVTPEVLAYALKNGFYVIVPSGETVNIEAPDGFKPRVW